MKWQCEDCKYWNGDECDHYNETGEMCIDKSNYEKREE
jgi:hypothetical protein